MLVILGWRRASKPVSRSRNLFKAHSSGLGRDLEITFRSAVNPSLEAAGKRSCFARPGM